MERFAGTLFYCSSFSNAWTHYQFNQAGFDLFSEFQKPQNLDPSAETLHELVVHVLGASL